MHGERHCQIGSASITHPHHTWPALETAFTCNLIPASKKCVAFAPLGAMLTQHPKRPTIESNVRWVLPYAFAPVAPSLCFLLLDTIQHHSLRRTETRPRGILRVPILVMLSSILAFSP